MTELEIIVLTGHKFVASQILTEREISIGSAATNTIKLDDPSVAPEHAIAHFTGRSCLVEDLDSPNGLIFANQRVSSHMMKTDDEITIGIFTLRFVIHREATEHTPLPAQSPIIAKAPAATTVAPVAVAAAPVAAPVAKPPEAPKAPLKEPPLADVMSDHTSIMNIDNLRSLVGRTVQPKAAPATASAAAAKLEPAKVEAPKPAPQVKPAVQVPQPLTQRAPVTPTVKVDLRQPKPTREVPVGTHTAAARAIEEDDDEDDSFFVPAFSLISQLTDKQRVDATGPAVAQAIFFDDEQVSGVHYLNSGAKLRVAGGRIVVSHNKDGQITVASRNPIRANVFKDGRPLQANVAQKGKTHVLLLPRGQAANLELNPSERLHLQFRAPIAKAEAAPLKLSIGKREGLIIALSIFFHLFAFTLIAILSNRQSQAEDDNAGRFAQIETKDLELEKPKVEPPAPPPPKEIAPPEPMPKPVPTQKAPPVSHKQPPTKTPPVRTATASPVSAPPTTPKPSAAASNLLSALGGAMSGGAPTSAATAATTNLDAVQAPRSGGFKVAGMIGKMPGDGLRLASAGGAVGRIDTKSAAELIKGGKGNVAGNAPSGNVRGVVTAPPARSVEVQGSLDRNEIQKVVNAHLHEVQACYERQLVHNPNLSGKVVAEWVVALTGSVGTVRIKNSTVSAVEVSTCIQAAIKRWTFPKPKGGQVTVTYPFVFSTVGM